MNYAKSGVIMQLFMYVPRIPRSNTTALDLPPRKKLTIREHRVTDRARSVSAPKTLPPLKTIASTGSVSFAPDKGEAAVTQSICFHEDPVPTTWNPLWDSTVVRMSVHVPVTRLILMSSRYLEPTY